jgi:hypothetical protein
LLFARSGNIINRNNYSGGYHVKVTGRQERYKKEASQISQGKEASQAGKEGQVVLAQARQGTLFPGFRKAICQECSVARP